MTLSVQSSKGQHPLFGQMGLAILKLFTLGGCGIWSVIDVVITGLGSMKDAQGNSLKVA